MRPVRLLLLMAIISSCTKSAVDPGPDLTTEITGTYSNSRTVIQGPVTTKYYHEAYVEKVNSSHVDVRVYSTWKAHCVGCSSPEKSEWTEDFNLLVKEDTSYFDDPTAFEYRLFKDEKKIIEIAKYQGETYLYHFNLKTAGKFIKN